MADEHKPPDEAPPEGTPVDEAPGTDASEGIEQATTEGAGPDGGAPAEAAAERPPAEAAPAPPQAAPPPPPPYRPPATPLNASPIARSVAQPVAAAREGGGETTFAAEYPEQSSRLWALLYLLFGVKVIVLIVHALIFIVLAIGALVVFVVAQAIVLFTGRMSEGMHRFQTRVLAQSNKMNGWIYGLTDALPPFMLSDDPYPIETAVGRPARSSRLWALLNIVWLKPLALLPHLIILYVLQIASAVVVFIAQIVILVTGRYPRGMFDFVVGVMRWQTRVAAFLYGLRDEYPPFSLE